MTKPIKTRTLKKKIRNDPLKNPQYSGFMIALLSATDAFLQRQAKKKKL